MKELLEKLRLKIAANPVDCYFDDPVHPGAINLLEDDLGIKLPHSFKLFLEAYNGGFISLLPGRKEMEFDTLAWNSNEFLSAGMIREAFDRINIKTEGKPYRFIPFLHTAIGEYLGFKFPLEGNESKVYDLWHEAPASEWAEMVVYDSLPSLLKDYIEKDGLIETMG